MTLKQTINKLNKKYPLQKDGCVKSVGKKKWALAELHEEKFFDELTELNIEMVPTDDSECGRMMAEACIPRGSVSGTASIEWFYRNGIYFIQRTKTG